jgi:hypothetical protein
LIASYTDRARGNKNLQGKRMKLKFAAALIAATAMAITFGATAARADYNGGDPIKKGKMCWVATDGLGHGMWAKCPKPMKAMKAHKKGGKKAKKAKK